MDSTFQRLRAVCSAIAGHLIVTIYQHQVRKSLQYEVISSTYVLRRH